MLTTTPPPTPPSNPAPNQTPADRTSHRSAWIIGGSVFAVLAMAYGVVAVVDLLSFGRSRFERTFTEEFTTLEIDSDGGSVRIEGTADRETVDRHVLHRAPGHDQESDRKDRLHVVGRRGDHGSGREARHHQQLRNDQPGAPSPHLEVGVTIHHSGDDEFEAPRQVGDADHRRHIGVGGAVGSEPDAAAPSRNEANAMPPWGAKGLLAVNTGVKLKVPLPPASCL